MSLRAKRSNLKSKITSSLSLLVMTQGYHFLCSDIYARLYSRKFCEKRMNRADIKEFYFITPIDNIASIFEYGLLSHNKIKASRLSHKSVAHGDVQKRREDKVIPGGRRKLHDYVNLYFNPRNSMMYSRKNLHEDLCVLAIDAGKYSVNTSSKQNRG